MFDFTIIETGTSRHNRQFVVLEGEHRFVFLTEAAAIAFCVDAADGEAYAINYKTSRWDFRIGYRAAA